MCNFTEAELQLDRISERSATLSSRAETVTHTEREGEKGVKHTHTHITAYGAKRNQRWDASCDEKHCIQTLFVSIK